MEYTINYKEEGKATIIITLSSEEWEKEIDLTYHKTKRRYAIPGFRKGHVPRKILESRFGGGLFFEDAFNDACPKFYEEVLQKQPKLFPVSTPDVEILSAENGIKFSMTVDLKPEVTLGKYKGWELPLVEYTVTDQDVENELKSAQEKGGRLVSVTDRAAQSGDSVKIDYSGSVDGVKFDGGTAENQDLVLGSNSFIPGFEDQVVGMNIGDSRDIKVTFPTDYQAEHLAGKEAVFAIKLHAISKKELPAIDDELAKDVSEFETLADYKADIIKKKQNQNQTKAKNDMENNLVECIVNDTKLQIPQSMIEKQIDMMIRDFENRLKYQGLKFDDFLKCTGKTAEEIRKDYQAEAEKQVKTRLIAEKIIETEDLKVSQQELDEKIKQMAEEVNMTPEQYVQKVPQYVEYFENQLLMDKLFEFLNNNNKFVAETKSKPKTKKTETGEEQTNATEQTAEKPKTAKPKASTAEKPKTTTKPKTEKPIKQD